MGCLSLPAEPCYRVKLLCPWWPSHDQDVPALHPHYTLPEATNAPCPLPPLGLGTPSEGLCFVHLGVLGLREIWGRTHSTCMIYSQLGTNHFKRRSYLVKESLGAVLGDVGWYGLLQQVKKRNWSKSCLEIQVSDLPASGDMSSSCHTREPWWHRRQSTYQDRGLRGSHGLSASTIYLSCVP